MRIKKEYLNKESLEPYGFIEEILYKDQGIYTIREYEKQEEYSKVFIQRILGTVAIAITGKSDCANIPNVIYQMIRDGLIEHEGGPMDNKWEQEIFEVYSEYEPVYTFIKAYKHEDSYIVHGETVIVCYDKNYEKLWEFRGRDIFVTQDGSSAFQLTEKGIWLKDWLGNSYLLGYDGRRFPAT